MTIDAINLKEWRRMAVANEWNKTMADGSSVSPSNEGILKVLDHIDTITAERDALASKMEQWAGQAGSYAADAVAARAERDQARAQVEELKEWITKKIILEPIDKMMLGKWTDPLKGNQ